MIRFSIGLLLAGIVFSAGAVRAQDASDCEKNGLLPERCLAWRSAAEAASFSLTLGQLDAHIAALAKAGRISQAKADARRQTLATSQAAWQTFRDRQCALPGAHPDGAEACRSQMAEARLAELQDPDVPEAGLEDKSWSERRVLQSPFYRGAWITLRLRAPPMRTVADRVALATGPRETQDWSFRKEVSDFQTKIRTVSGFGPLTSGFIAAEWDMLRYDPETGARLHQGPETIEGSPADNNWDKNEAEAFAAKLPACLRNLADPQCRVQYSTELGCRYDADMAAVCQTRLDGLRGVFKSFNVTTPEHRDQFYKAIACLTPAPFDERFTRSFLVPDSLKKAAPNSSSIEGRPCSDLGLAADGNGWAATGASVFGVTMDLEIR